MFLDKKDRFAVCQVSPEIRESLKKKCDRISLGLEMHNLSKTGFTLSSITNAKGLATPVAHPTARTRTPNQPVSIATTEALTTSVNNAI